MSEKKILVVCLGNICRSPIAEGLFQKQIDEKGLPWRVDSAGTSGWHDGEGPDERSVTVCRKYDVDISNQISRKIRPSDFEHFDFIMAMDDENLKKINLLAPPKYKNKVYRMMDFHPTRSQEIVPDPYYDNRFQEVYDLLLEVVDHAVISIMDDQNPKEI